MARALFRRIAICMTISLLIGAALSEAAFKYLHYGESRPPKIVEIDIPAGTAAGLARGQADPSIPSNLSFVLGDTLLVKNDDSVLHELGPLVIPPGTQATMKLDTGQDFVVTCSFEPTRYLGLNIYPPITAATRIEGGLEVGLNLGFVVSLYSLFALPFKKKKVVTL